ncbi:unnamed protein product [Schistocephalus solidus]|uniref:GIY-YIG domain-containing protein n=1 Tax=Schistocephalus solidus TaxID=70667 RepID=A0A183SSF8_SCHSO|nr:unnamed protein product [Schistocephalus solidus]
MGVGHRPEATIRRLVMQPKGQQTPADTSGVIYRVNCLDCPANYCGMTDKRLITRMHEHTLAVRRKDIRSHIAMHSLENNHRFDFDGAQVLGRAENRLAREVIEAWQSDANSINRSIDIPVLYEAVKHHWRTRGRPMRNKVARPIATDQIKVLQHESGFNTGDAHTVDFIASLEVTLSKTQTTEDAKKSIRQKAPSIIISHRPHRTISPAEVKAIRELKKDEEIVIVPADKERATVILDKSEYVAKAQELLNDNVTQCEYLIRISTPSTESGLVRPRPSVVHNLKSPEKHNKEDLCGNADKTYSTVIPASRVISLLMNVYKDA